MQNTNLKEVTIRDLAAMLDLSSATVSRALNHDGSVTKKTMSRVFDLAQKLGYRGNEHARLLRNGRSNTIGCIVPKLDHYLWSAIVAGVEKAARREDYSIVVMQSDDCREQEADCASQLFNKRIDALLVGSAGYGRDLRHFQPFIKKNIPVVLLDRYGNDPGFLNLYVDNLAAGYEMTRHLLARGRKRIVHLTANTGQPAYIQRYEGYKKALEEARIPVKEQYIIKCGLTPQDGIAAAETICRWKQRPDAVFAAGDHCAVACLTTLQRKGLRIPKEMAVAGFDNDPVSLATDPPLTSMRYPGRQAGEKAVHQVIHRLNSAPPAKFIDPIVLRGELIIRGSTQDIDY